MSAYKPSTLVPGTKAYDDYWVTQIAPGAPADVAAAVRAGTATRAMVEAYPFGVLRVLREAKPALAYVKAGFDHAVGADREPLSHGETAAAAVWAYMHAEELNRGAPAFLAGGKCCRYCTPCCCQGTNLVCAESKAGKS
jgi:hypothetical protein